METQVKPLSYSQSLTHSANDSAESIATPPDSDLEDEQIRKMLPTVIQRSAEVEHELLSLSSDSWTDAQQPNLCTPTVVQGFAEHVCLPTDDPIEDFSEEDMATGSMASAGRSPNKHPRTGSEEDSVDIAALLDRAADRFSACTDTKVDSMMDRLEKRIDEKIDSKLGPVMDRMSVLEKASSSTRSRPSSLSDNGGSTCQSSTPGGNTPALFAPSYLEIKGGVDLETETHMA